MAWQMNYTDQYGDNYAQSYWRVVQCNLQKEEQTGQVIFNGYENGAKAGQRIIGQKAYYVTPALYQQYFLPTLVQPQGVDHIKQCYAMSGAVLDTPHDTGTLDTDQNP